MGRLTFSADEIAEIRRLLVELRRADRDRQKMIRAKIRRIGFSSLTSATTLVDSPRPTLTLSSAAK
jgi:hypothetical protein